MGLRQKALGELKVFALSFLYFAICFLVLMALKKLILDQYEIGYYGLSAALVGALIVAKVVMVLEYVPLGKWVQRRPVLVDVTVRTLLYSLGVLIAMTLERGFEERHEHAGFGNAIVAVVGQRNFYHVWATTIAVGATIMGFNVFAAIRMRFGYRNLVKLFFKTPLIDLEAGEAGVGSTAPERQKLM